MKQLITTLISTFILGAAVLVPATAYAWTTSQSAEAKCSESNDALIVWEFSNTESAGARNAIDLIVTDNQSGVSSQEVTVDPGETVSGSILPGPEQINSGNVTFHLTWTDGHNGTDSRTLSYSAVDCREEEPEPILECKTLTALPASAKPDEDVTFTATANAENGATITKYVFNFDDGDDTTVNTVAETATTTHAYDETGTYNASVTVNDNVTSNSCKTTVTVEEEPKNIQVCRDGKVITIKETDRRSTDTNAPCPEEQIQVCRDGKVITIDEDHRKSTDTNAPCVLGEKELPNTGVGSAMAGFFGTSALFASARTWLSSRRQLRAGALKQSK